MSATQRLPQIPLSPSSPPETGIKRKRSIEVAGKLPPSPEYMSVATKSYVTSYGNTSHMDETTSRSSPRSPSSSSSYNHSSTQRASQAYSTPTSTTSGIPGLNMLDETDQHRDKRQKLEPQENEQNTQMETDNTIMPTNHERQDPTKKEEGQTPAMSGIEIHMNEAEKQMPEDISLKQLDDDIGDAFLLCKSKIPPQRPNPEKHLLHMYGLGPVLKSVARFDPVTQEKAVKMRKSYEGQMKGFGLSGKNRPATSRSERERESNNPGPIRRAIGSTNEEGLLPNRRWDPENREDRKVEITQSFRSKLRSAIQLQPGPVRDAKRWEDLLGSDPPPRQAPIPAPSQVVPQVQKAPNGVVRSGAPHHGDLKRQTRGKKRSYGDDSFVGYGEGYSEGEDADPDDYGDDEGGNRRKRRKESLGGPLGYVNSLGRG